MSAILLDSPCDGVLKPTGITLECKQGEVFEYFRIFSSFSILGGYILKSCEPSTILWNYFHPTSYYFRIVRFERKKIQWSRMCARGLICSVKKGREFSSKLDWKKSIFLGFEKVSKLVFFVCLHQVSQNHAIAFSIKKHQP